MLRLLNVNILLALISSLGGSGGSCKGTVEIYKRELMSFLKHSALLTILAKSAVLARLV